MVRTEEKGRERWEKPLGVELRAFTNCLDAGEEREEEEWRVHPRVVHFNLTAIRSMGGGTDFRERQACKGRIIELRSPQDIQEMILIG